jgi:hypothetical protein
MGYPMHFYLTFNPYLNEHEEPHYTQAHEFYEKLLANFKSNPGEQSLWWGKITKSGNKEIKLEDFKKIVEENKNNKVSTHLYITNFNQLWVGKVEAVSAKAPKDSETLDFYKGREVEVWFKLTDFTLLENTPETTANKLSELYIDNPYSEMKLDEVTPYSTGMKYPAIVQDLSEEHFFDELDEGEPPLIAQAHPAINNMASMQTLKYINAYALPESIYKKLPHAAKAEIEIAEIDILENRHHNNKRIAFSYIKAFEIIMNDLVIHHLKRKNMADDIHVVPVPTPPRLHFEPQENSIPLSQFHKNFSINQLIHFLLKGMKSNFCVKKAFAEHRPFVEYVTNELKTQMKKNNILEIRGILAHGESDDISVHDALAIRNLMLGIGCRGLIHSVYQSFYHKEFKDFTKVLGKYESKGEKLTRTRKAA